LTGRRAFVLHEARQIASFDVLHHEEVDSPGLVGVEGGHDVGVGELGDCLDLAAEALDGIG